MEDIIIKKEDLQALINKVNKLETENNTLKTAGFMLLEIVKLSGLDIQNLKGLNITSITAAIMRLMGKQAVIESLITDNKQVFNELKTIYEREQPKLNG